MAKKQTPVKVPGYYTRDEAAGVLDCTPQALAHLVRKEYLPEPIRLGSTDRAPALYPRGPVDALASRKKAGNFKRGRKKAS